MICPDADTRRIKKHFYNKHVFVFATQCWSDVHFSGTEAQKNQKKTNIPNCVGARFLFMKS